MVQLKHFDTYQILRKLGRSMTDVYLAFDPARNRKVILKLGQEVAGNLSFLTPPAPLPMFPPPSTR